MQALLTGQGPLADHLAQVLTGQGFGVTRAATSVGAHVVGSERLLVTVAPAIASGLQDALDEIVLAPVRLAQALAQAQPAPVRDASGELRAPAQVVHVLDRAALVPGCADPALAAASAALVAAMRDTALSLAPRLRVNALAVDLTCAQDSAPALVWLLGAHAVTGQMLGLGADPRPATRWRLDATQ